MKRTLIVAAIAALAGTSAFAQTTIYGRVNVTLERQKDGGASSTNLNNNASRIGFKGTEDLGGGLKANFILEHGFNIDNGTAAAVFWGRQSEVNLSSGMGMLRLGRFTSEAYFATADYISMHNHDTGRSEDRLYAYIGNNSNKIAYRTPSMAGATVEIGVSLKESGTDNTYDLAANWQGGPLHLGLGYEKNGNKNQVGVRALYEMGPFTFGAYYQRDKNAYGSGSRDNVRLSGMYTMGASEFHLNIGHADAYSNVSGSSASQYTLGYNYNLSKRTKAYTYYTKLSDKGTIYGDQSSFAVGVRHNF